MTTDYLHVSYNDVINGYIPENDDYSLVTRLTEARFRAFFENPLLKDKNQPLLNLATVDNVICGRSTLFETQVVINGEIERAQSMSTLDVIEKFREYGLGPGLFSYASTKTEPKYVLCSGISDSAMPLYTMMRFKMLTFPRLMYFNNIRSLIESYGFSRGVSKCLSFFANIPFKLVGCFNSLQAYLYKKTYTVRKEYQIPKWVEDLTIRDKHKYKEAHTAEWLQWNLDYNFKGYPEDIQRFYTISKNDRPLGFFMIKERYRKEAGGKLKDIILGAIVEWGSYDESLLDESMINIIALSCFSSKVDIIEFASSDSSTVRKMKRRGFIQHGTARIALRDKTKQLKDLNDIDNWRIRYGYADVILT